MEDTFTEWRLIADVSPATAALDEIIAQAREKTPADVDVHRRGQQIMVYALGEDEIRAAETLLMGILAGEGAGGSATLTRWNPGRERWQEPNLPIEPPRRRLEASWVRLGELAFELRMRVESRTDLRKLERKLKGEGRPVITDGWKRITVGVASETEAAELAVELRLVFPRTQIEVRPLSRWRRWLIRQAALGNYA